jgi:tetratricopeptide (TPR) repeat protein
MAQELPSSSLRQFIEKGIRIEWADNKVKQHTGAHEMVKKSGRQGEPLFFSSVSMIGFMDGCTVNQTVELFIKRGEEMSGETGDRYFQEGERKRTEAHFAEALEAYQEALTHYREEESAQHLTCYQKTGDCLRMIGDFAAARESFANALSLAQQGGAEVEVADALMGLGLSARGLGEVEEAQGYLQRAKGIYEEWEDPEGEAYALWSLGGLWRIAGELRKAKQSFEEALSLSEGMGDPTGMAYALCGLGGVSRVRGHYRDSLAYYTRAHTIVQEIKDVFGTAYSFCGMANAHRMSGDFERAFGYFGRATDLYQDIGDRISYAYTLWGEGTALKMVGKDEEALEAFLTAEAIFQKTEDHRGRIYTILGRGEIALLQEAADEADRMLREASDIAESHPFRLERCHCHLFQVLMRREAGEDASPEEVRKEYRRVGSEFPAEDVSLPLNLP